MRSVRLPLCLVFLISFVVLFGCRYDDSNKDIKSHNAGKTDRRSAQETSGTSDSTMISGRVAVGYLREARVFLDQNGNRRLDQGEPQTLSTAGGRFSLAVTSDDAKKFPLFVDVVVGQSIDEQSRQKIQRGFFLEASAGRWQFISPLTTLVKIVQEQNPSFTELQAVLRVRAAFGLDDRVSLFTDYLQPISEEGPLAAEYQRAYRAAKVIAALFAAFQNELPGGDAGQNVGERQRAGMFWVVDQIFSLAPTIRQRLDETVAQSRNNAIETLLADSLAAVAPLSLSPATLERYRQRIAQNPPLWDMQPPRLLARFPTPEGFASIATDVALEFDEPLDEARLDRPVLTLTGNLGDVPGRLIYQPEKKSLLFKPAAQLQPGTTYRVRLSRAVTDLLGNSRTEDLSWTFRTTSSALPPELPQL